MSLSFEGRAESLRNVVDGNLLLEKRLVETVKASEATNDQGRKVRFSFPLFCQMIISG